MKGKLYIKCPICKVVMNRKLVGAGSGVIVDVCRAHGTFFDVGELPVIITYVQQGGLEKQAKKDIERMRDSAKREHHGAAAMARGAVAVADYDSLSLGRRNHGSPGGFLVDRLVSLWRA